jgi:hypothetical protein
MLGLDSLTDVAKRATYSATFLFISYHLNGTSYSLLNELNKRTRGPHEVSYSSIPQR